MAPRGSCAVAASAVFHNRTTRLVVVSMVVLLGRWALRWKEREHTWVTFLFALPQRRMKVASVVIVPAVAVTGLVVGAWNDHFLMWAHQGARWS